MSNKARLILFAVFALFTFYQFYTYAKSFHLSDFLPPNPHTVLYGTFLTTSSPSPVSQIDFAIPLLALNIVLLVERPTQIGRRSIILAFIANLFIMVARVGFGTPAIKKAIADLQNNPTTTYTSPFPRWNALYLVIATISTLIVISQMIVLLRHNHFILPYLSRTREQFRTWRQTPVVRKLKLVLFLVFTLLTFYQFVSHANPIHHDPSKVKDAINKIMLSRRGNADVSIVVTSDSDPVSPIPFLLLTLNIVLWANYPQQIGRLLLTLSFFANLAIVLIQNITEAAFQRAGGYLGMGIDARYLQLDQRDNLYRLFATMSALIVVAMLIQIWRKRQIVIYPRQ